MGVSKATVEIQEIMRNPSQDKYTRIPVPPTSISSPAWNIFDKLSDNTTQAIIPQVACKTCNFVIVKHLVTMVKHVCDTSAIGKTSFHFDYSSTEKVEDFDEVFLGFLERNPIINDIIPQQASTPPRKKKRKVADNSTRVVLPAKTKRQAYLREVVEEEVLSSPDFIGNRSSNGTASRYKRKVVTQPMIDISTIPKRRASEIINIAPLQHSPSQLDKTSFLQEEIQEFLSPSPQPALEERLQEESISSQNLQPSASQQEIPASSSQGLVKPQKSTPKRLPREAAKPKRADRPRWYNQSYLVFLALREANRPMKRPDLIKAALAMDKKISRQRGLPKLFLGQTPSNTCSAILTENRDKFFVPSKPPGSKSTIFTLSYKPNDFDTAWDMYTKWNKELWEVDWPMLFDADRYNGDEGVKGDAKSLSEVTTRMVLEIGLNGGGDSVIEHASSNSVENPTTTIPTETAQIPSSSSAINPISSSSDSIEIPNTITSIEDTPTNQTKIIRTPSSSPPKPTSKSLTTKLQLQKGFHIYWRIVKRRQKTVADSTILRNVLEVQRDRGEHVNYYNWRKGDKNRVVRKSRGKRKVDEDGILDEIIAGEGKEMGEEEEIQLALALSLSEKEQGQEEKEVLSDDELDEPSMEVKNEERLSDIHTNQVSSSMNGTIDKSSSPQPVISTEAIYTSSTASGIPASMSITNPPANQVFSKTSSDTLLNITTATSSSSRVSNTITPSIVQPSLTLNGTVENLASSIDSPSKTQNIPKTIDDILYVDTSTIPNAGKGCFAKRFIPKYTIIGFYFGVPMHEDEFDSLKDHVGVASRYSIRYRNTILDATNPQGQVYTDPSLPGYCHFHYVNEDVLRQNMVFVDGPEVNQIWALTFLDLREGDELFVAYGDEVDRGVWEEMKDAGEEDGGEVNVDLAGK